MDRIVHEPTDRKHTAVSHERPSSSNLHVDNTHGSSRISAIRTDAHVDTLEVVKMKIQGLERMAGEAS